MSGHLAIVFYIKMVDFFQPYLLEKVAEKFIKNKSYITELWRIQTPNCFENRCPTHFDYNNRGELPKNVYEKHQLFNKLESYLELYHKNRIFFENGGVINQFGLFNISVFEETQHLINPLPRPLKNLEFVSCYEPVYFNENKNDIAFKREWDLNESLKLDEYGRLLVDFGYFNLERRVDVFEKWYVSLTRMTFPRHLIYPVNIRKKVKLSWTNGYGWITRLTQFYENEGVEIKEEL